MMALRTRWPRRIGVGPHRGVAQAPSDPTEAPLDPTLAKAQVQTFWAGGPEFPLLPSGLGDDGKRAPPTPSAPPTRSEDFIGRSESDEFRSDGSDSGGIGTVRYIPNPPPVPIQPWH